MLKSSIFLALLLLPAVVVLASDDSIIECEVKLAEYLPEQPYYEEINGSHYDFVVPVATFTVVSPSILAERHVRVIFLSTRFDNLQSDLRQGVGTSFLLRIPKDYFDYADGTTIKSDQVESIFPIG